MNKLVWYAVFALALHISGCGGGGGGGGGASGSSGAPPPSTPATPAADGNAPPTTGTFGGGQGKILFAEGINLPKSVTEFDLATRQVRTLTVIKPALSSFVLAGGVTRANDGTFAVSGHDISDPVAKTAVYSFQPDGTFVHGWIMDRAMFEGGALSPDAKSVAFAESTQFEDRLQVLILDLQSGAVVSGDLLGTNDPPRNKADLHANAVWSQTGDLYVISEVGLHRVDRVSGASTLLYAVTLARPRAPVLSSDARTLYFHQLTGNPHGGTVWSMDLATGALTRRSVRSKDGDQYAPALSPDGTWLLMQEADNNASAIAFPPGLPLAPNPPNPIGGAIAVPLVVSAVRLAEPPVDTQGLATRIVDAAGKGHSASGRMVWY